MNPLAAKTNNNIEHSSNSQIILAVSNWLQQSLPAEDDNQQQRKEPSQNHKICTSLETTLNVPAVYSHEYWFDLAISPICEEIAFQLDSDLQEGPRICHLLNFIIELCQRIDDEHCGRERMVEMLVCLFKIQKFIKKFCDQIRI